MKLAVVALFALLAAWMASPASPTTAVVVAQPEPPLTYSLPPDLPVVTAARRVCRLVGDSASAARATVLGVDGAQSVVSGGRAYWLFGDTFRQGPGGRRDVIAAGMATSADFDARDCVDLTFRTDAAGIVQPMFPRGDETTAWPDGSLAMPDGSIVFYMVKSYRTSPTHADVGAIGLGVIPAGSMTGVRLTEKIWDGNSGFYGNLAGARSPLRIGDDVYVYINTDEGNYLARVPAGRMTDAAAYTYWDGTAWTSSPWDARALWHDEPSMLPADNGVSVSFDNRIGKWLAMYNAGLWTIKVRLADNPWGPWSAPVSWFDCEALADGHYPYCYSSSLHGELTRDGGDTLYVTFANPEPYDVSLVELRLGVAVRAWTREAGDVRYAITSPAGGYTDAGIAFYASATPLPGGIAVYEAQTPSGERYGIDAPSAGATPAFYAYASPPFAPIHTEPVYRWQRDDAEILDAADRPGWTRGDVAFYVSCIDFTSAGAGTTCLR